jgi:hypothetical protein
MAKSFLEMKAGNACWYWFSRLVHHRAVKAFTKL